MKSQNSNTETIVNASAVDAELYQRFRPFYPTETFARFKEFVLLSASLADIGCGGGQSTYSLQQALAPEISQFQLHGLDPEASMLEKAQELFQSQGLTCQWTQAFSHQLPFGDQALDGAIIGSAIHWMQPAPTHNELARVLRPGAPLLIFEYQFPKAVRVPALNDWIRSEFNRNWKAPLQVPRGDFKAITQPFRQSPLFQLIEDKKIPMIQSLQASQLLGLLLSQSRVVHYERTLNEAEKRDFRRRTLDTLSELMNTQAQDFDFRLTTGLWRRRAP